MTQKEFIVKLAARLQWDETRTSEFIEIISNILAGELSDNNRISIEGFGVFSTIKNKEYILTDDETAERYLMPPEVAVHFEPYRDESAGHTKLLSEIFFDTDDSLKRNINSAFQNFEPVLINEGVEFPGIEVINTAEPEPDTNIQPDTHTDTQLNSAPEPPVDDKIIVVPQRRVKSKSRSRKTSGVLFPVLSGVVIVMATLFFFKGVAKQKSGDSSKSRKS